MVYIVINIKTGRKHWLSCFYDSEFKAFKFIEKHNLNDTYGVIKIF